MKFFKAVKDRLFRFEMTGPVLTKKSKRKHTFDSKAVRAEPVEA